MLSQERTSGPVQKFVMLWIIKMLKEESTKIVCKYLSKKRGKKGQLIEFDYEKYETFAVKNVDKGNIQTLCACSAVEDIEHNYECEIYTEIKETYKYIVNGNNILQTNVYKNIKTNTYIMFA